MSGAGHMRRCALTGLAAFTLAGLAMAAVQWYEYYERGLVHERAGRWAQAVDELKETARLAPTPRKRVNTYGQNYLFEYDPYVHLARCYLELEQPELAAEALAQSERAAVTPASTLDALRERLEAARLRFPALPSPAPAHLTIASAPAGAVALVDGRTIGSIPTEPLALPPGAHVVRLEVPGRDPVERTVALEAGQVLSLDLSLPAAPVATNPSIPEDSEPTPAPSPSPPPASPTIARLPTSAAPVRPPAGQGAAAAPPTEPPSPTDRPDPVHALTAESRPQGRFDRRLGLVALAGAGILAWWVAGVLRRRRVPAGLSGPTRMAPPSETTQVGSGRNLGPYELHETLGRGGMAATYRATRRSDGATLAVKIPHEGCLLDEGFRNRFLREGQLGQQLHHPNIVRIFDTGETNERLYLAMELLHGRTLKDELRGSGAMPLDRALEVARDIAEALDYAHAKGIIHRDLKPENIMVLPDGAIKVMDFGIARVSGQAGLTGTNSFLGTPLYAAPESVDARHVDHRADLYALGIILFEMLQGTPPFVAESPFRLLEMHLRQPLPRPDTLPRPVPPRTWAMIARLCEKDRDARYTTAAELLVDLNRHLHDLPQQEA